MKLNRKYIASLDVDAQCGFSELCPNELPVPGALEIVEELNAQAKFATLRLGSKDAHPANPIWLADKDHPVLSKLQGQANADVYWPAHCVVGTAGFESLPGLPYPENYDFMVYKGMEHHLHPYGCCFHDLRDQMSTGLIEFLFQSNHSHVIVGGLATDYCVATTCIQLLGHGLQVILNLGACRGISQGGVDKFLEQTKETFGPRFRVVNNAKELEGLIE